MSSKISHRQKNTGRAPRNKKKWEDWKPRSVVIDSLRRHHGGPHKDKRDRRSREPENYNEGWEE